MTWREWHTARQLLAEERLGTLVREAKAVEDAQFAQSSKHLRRQDGPR
jgi:hypothetical protein